MAVIDEDKLKLPLDGSMFKSLYPDGGVPDPWLPGTEWRYMFCRRCGNVHTVFAVPDDDVEGMMERGGPMRLLTDQGWVDLVKEDGIQCPHCDFTAKSEQGLKVHITAKHKDG